MAEFSFEQDVAPFASRYFQRMQANPILSTARKTQLSDDLLSKLEAVKAESDKDVERSLSMEIRRTQLERERLALEDARLEAQQKREAIAAEPVVNAEFESLFDDVADPREQTRRLNLFAMRNANVIDRSPTLKAKYRFASGAIMRPELTPYQQIQLQRQEAAKALELEKWKANYEQEERSIAQRDDYREASAARREREYIDKMLDAEISVPEEELFTAKQEGREPLPKFKNLADRGRILDVMAEYGVDVSEYENASDYEVFEAGRRFRRKLITQPTAATAPPLIFD